MKILFVGDIVGRLGRNMLENYLHRLVSKYKPQVNIVNGENSTDRGRGISEKIYKSFMQLGADVVTLGNHAFDNEEIFDFIDHSKKLVRPANFPEATTPGTGLIYLNINQTKLAVINLQGTALMQNLDDPFMVAEELVEQARQHTPNIFMDFHAETTSEKQAMAYFLDGRVSAVVGTHTHVQTNDARVLPGGTAFLTDVGMTGPADSIIGMKKEDVLRRYVTKLPTRFNVQENGPGILSACIIEIEEETGKAISIKNIVISDDQSFFD